MLDVDELLNKCTSERLFEKRSKEHSLAYQAELVFCDFRRWCFKKHVQESESNFKQYMSELNQDINFWIKKKIFEVYFNYIFTWDYDKVRWACRKV